MLLCSNGCTGIMMYEGETEKESRDSLNMVEQMKIMYGAIKLAVIHGAPLSDRYLGLIKATSLLASPKQEFLFRSQIGVINIPEQIHLYSASPAGRRHCVPPPPRPHHGHT